MSCQTKDCDCVIHEGAHWLHMDRLTASMTLKLYDEAVRTNNVLGLYGFARAEEMRLETKLHEMKSRGIERHCAPAVEAATE